jgi:outer membrane protein OmpA-like peptidoglycan-associated protein
VTAPVIAAFVNRVVAAAGRMSVVVADGQPRAVSAPISTAVSGDNDRMKANARQALNASIASTLAAATPTTAEADVLMALSLAARATSGHAAREVLVIDSGISTTGMVAMQTGIINAGADVSAYVTALKDARQLPDLTGVTVRWAGMGSVAAPQSAIENATLSRLQSFWTEVVHAANGALLIDDVPVVGEQPAPSAPKVTAVTFDDKAPAVPPIVVVLSTQVTFQANHDVFADKPTATAALQQVCSEILARGFATVKVTGTTSDDGSPMQGQITLSQRRADRVGQWFHSTCSPNLHIITMGVGPNFPGYIVDRDANGRPIEEQAAKNRLTIISASA